MHKKFALYPAEIDVKEILADDFYKFIGLKTAAEAENLIYKYHLYSIIEYKEGLIKTIYPYDRLFALIFPDKA
ncbi:MAG: hypothetical protein MZV64_27495 [Ignavibacteriales bacterium]|nr:hypothetical protein [Ignavibacteriales bacterium]